MTAGLWANAPAGRQEVGLRARGTQCMELHAVRPSLEETLSRHMLRSRGGYKHLHCTGSLARNVATLGAWLLEPVLLTA